MGILMLNFRSPFEKLIIITGFLSIFLGSTVLIGWYSGNLIMIQINESFVPMQYNTALGFLFCGVGLISLHNFPIKLTGLAGFFTTVLAGLTLIPYLFEMDLGIDQILMNSYIIIKTSHSGRMAPNTALCFLLAGLALLNISVLGEIRKRFVTIRV